MPRRPREPNATYSETWKPPQSEGRGLDLARAMEAARGPAGFYFCKNKCINGDYILEFVLLLERPDGSIRRITTAERRTSEDDRSRRAKHRSDGAREVTTHEPMTQGERHAYGEKLINQRVW